MRNLVSRRGFSVTTLALAVSMAQVAIAQTEALEEIIVTGTPTVRSIGGGFSSSCRCYQWRRLPY